MNTTIVNFSETYAEARERFLGGVAAYGIAVESEPHPEHRGATGETLAIDAALLGDPAAPSLFILTSGTHGAEGFCGSACQTMLIHDVILRRRIEDKRVAVLLVHAVNPWGFSHLSRTNEDGIDLNRNFMDFGKPLPENPVYEAAHALLVPDTWPPTEAHEARVRSMMRR